MKLTIAISLFTISLTCFASFDSQIRGLFRSYPLSASIDADGGYNFMIWKRDELLYGYLRPSLNYLNAGSFNALTAEASLFPISFFNITAGYIHIINNSNYDQFNCIDNNCTGTYTSKYFSAYQLVGYKDIFGRISYRVAKRDQESHDKDFIMPGAVLQGDRDGETVETWTVLAGAKLSQKLKLSLLYNRIRALHNGSSSTLATVNVQYKREKWNAFASLGTLKATIKRRNYTLLAGYSWVFQDGIGLK